MNRRLALLIALFVFAMPILTLAQPGEAPLEYHVDVKEGKSAPGVPAKKWLDIYIVYAEPPEHAEAYKSILREIAERQNDGLNLNAYAYIGNKNDRASWKQMSDTDGAFVYAQFDAATKAVDRKTYRPDGGVKSRQTFKLGEAPAPAQQQQPPMTPQEIEAEAKRLESFALGTTACVLGTLLFVAISVSLPILIALARGHPDTVAIALVAIFLGWSGIGWLIAMIWAVKSFPRDRSGDARDY